MKHRPPLAGRPEFLRRGLLQGGAARRRIFSAAAFGAERDLHYLWGMETLTQILVDWGYGGLFVAAAIAGSVVPFSSEAVLVVLLGMGADPLGCLAAASAGNTLGGMTCYWIGTLGRTEWIAKLGVSTRPSWRRGPP